MSNVTLFRDERNVTAASAQGVDEITRRLLGGGGLNIKRISIRGGKWRVMSNGEQVAVSPSEKLDVVVMNAAEHVSRYWYASGYDGKTKGAPDCWSNDGSRPDPRAKQPQHSACEGCPKNIAGSGVNGTGRACRYARRLALGLVGDTGVAAEVYQIQLPPTSLFGKAKDDNHMGLDAYVRHLAAYNYSITGVVTEMRFDPNAEAPRIYFRAVRPLKDEEREIVIEQGQSPEALAAIAFNPGSIDTGTPPTALPAQPKASPFRDAAPRHEIAEEAAPVQREAIDVAPTQNEGSDGAEEFVQAAPVKEAEPVIRRNQSKAAAPAPKADMAKLIEEWDLDDE